MKDIPNDNPPVDQPANNGVYNFEWFKLHYFKILKEHHHALDQQFNNLPQGKGYPQEEIKIMLKHLDELISLLEWLPNSRGGQGTMKEIIQSRAKFEAAYLDKETNSMSFWDAQEMNFKVFSIYNYMSAMCED